MKICTFLALIVPLASSQLVLQNNQYTQLQPQLFALINLNQAQLIMNSASLISLENKIDKLDLAKGSTLNVNDAKAVKVDKLER